MSSKNKKKLDILAEMQASMKNAVQPMQVPDEITERTVVLESVPKKIRNVPWYPPNSRIKKELKQLALDEETTMSKLITEGIDMVFKSRGKASVDELTDK